MTMLVLDAIHQKVYSIKNRDNLVFPYEKLTNILTTNAKRRMKFHLMSFGMWSKVHFELSTSIDHSLAISSYNSSIDDSSRRWGLLQFFPNEGLMKSLARRTQVEILLIHRN